MKKYGCFIAAFILVIILLLGLVTFNRYNDAVNKKSSSSTEKVSITIDNGESIDSIKKKLIENGVIKDEDILFGNTAFKIYTFLNKNKVDKTIQAGSYQMEKGLSIKNALEILQSADTQDMKLTIKEGLRIEEIADEINSTINTVTNRKSKFNKNDFINLAKNYPSSREFLKTRPQNIVSLEGYLFPDTYFLSYDTTAADIINIMLDNFDAKIYTPNLGRIKNNKYSFHSLVTFGSIIQREVQTKADMAMIADVYFKRDRDGMKLDADATTQYGLGYSDAEGVWWKRDLTDKDLQSNSPYNTRKFTGLPPGPISSFGTDAFDAVLSPTANPYYFYISDANCTTRYAKTEAEHLTNIRNYGLCT